MTGRSAGRAGRAPRHGDDLPAHGRLLAIDLGDVRIGLARTDAGQTVASPAGTVLVADVLGAPLSTDGRGAEAGTPEVALSTLADAVAVSEAADEVVGVVVGYPRTLAGREGAAATRARRFADVLRARSGLPVTLWDERLTSVEAERSLSALGVRGARRRERVDPVAASLILQGYLAARSSGQER